MSVLIRAWPIALRLLFISQYLLLFDPPCSIRFFVSTTGVTLDMHDATDILVGISQHFRIHYFYSLLHLGMRMMKALIMELLNISFAEFNSDHCSSPCLACFERDYRFLSFLLKMRLCDRREYSSHPRTYLKALLAPRTPLQVDPSIGWPPS